jgi:hypothetical protein
MKAWHFIGEDKKLRYNDGREAVVGGTLTVDASKLKLCEFGLHASVDIMHALSYAPGTVLCEVELSGTVIKGDDKVCASERKVLWMKDIRKELILFACDCAERRLDKFEEKFPEDKRPRKAIEATREYVKKGGDIQVVKDAAYAAYAAAYAANAAYDAAYAANAAYAAAYAANAAYDANAAYAAANAANAAYAAAYAANAAYDAARKEEQAWQKKRLMYYIREAKKCAK